MSLAKEFKQLSKDTLIYGLSTGLGRMVTLFMAPILTRIFAPEDYGVIALIQVAIGFAVMLAGMNIGSGVSYYYFHHEDEEDRRNTLTSGFSAIVFLSLLMAGALALFAPQVAKLLQIRSEGPVVGHDMALYLRIGALGLFFGLMKTGFQSLLRLLHRPKKYLVVEVAALVSNVIAALVLVVWLRLGVEGVFWAGVIGPCIGFLLGLFFVADRFGRVFSWVLLIPVLAYALPQLPGVVLNWFQSQLGRIFINYYTSLSEQGLYSIAFALASVLVMATTAFRLAYDPYALSIMKRPDAPKTYARVYSLFGFVFGCLLGLVVAFAKPVLQVLTPAEYHDAHLMVFWLAAAGFYMGANNIVATGIWLSRRTIFTSYAQGISFLILVPANFLLVPAFGAFGAAAAFFIGAFAQSITYYVFTQRLHPIPFEYWRIHGLVFSLVLVGWVHSNLVLESGLIESLAISLPTAVSSILLAWFICFTKRQRKEAFDVLRKKMA